MADKTIEELQAQLAAANKQLSEQDAALKSAAATGIVSPPVPGTFSVTGETKDGKKETKKYRFLNGRIRTPLPNGQQVPSAALIELANGKPVDQIQGVATFPWFAAVTQEEAQAILARLVAINAATIEQVK
jgi:hypothetical protein